MRIEAALSFGSGWYRHLAESRHRIVLAFALVAFSATVIAQRHFIPLWDSWIYANCVVDAAESPFQLERHGCAGHFSHAYVFLLGIPQRLGLGDMPGILLVNMLLGQGAILALYSVARSTMPGHHYRMDSALLACVWAVHPAFLASAVFVNIDYGVVVFGLMTLACLLRNRFYAATLFGLLLVFSKEVGGLVYAVFIASYVVFVIGRGPGSPLRKCFRVLQLWPLAIPLVMLWVYVLWIRPSASALWGNLTPFNILDQLTTVRLLTPTSAAAFVGIFVLSFSWIPSVVSLVDLFLQGVGWCIKRNKRTIEAAHSGKLNCVFCITGLLVYCLTRIQTSVSVRYFVVLFPLLLLACLVASVRLSPGTLPRRALLVSLVGLFFASSFRTIDPLSKRLYGSFQFGDRVMLAMTSLNKECCGYGIDQLVYNLEFVHIHEALDQALLQLKPTLERPIIIADSTDWFLLARMNSRTFQRTLHKEGSDRVPHMDITELALQASPPELDFLALATIDNSSSIRQLQSRYGVVAVRRFGENGYWINDYQMHRRP